MPPPEGSKHQDRCTGNACAANWGQAGNAFAWQVAIPGAYKDAPVGDDCKADIVVAHEPILEIKAVTAILPIHEVQRRTGPRWPGSTRPSA
jgi:GxxExxY protein